MFLSVLSVLNIKILLQFIMFLHSRLAAPKQSGWINIKRQKKTCTSELGSEGLLDERNQMNDDQR